MLFSVRVGAAPWRHEAGQDCRRLERLVLLQPREPQERLARVGTEPAIRG